MHSPQPVVINLYQAQKKLYPKAVHGVFARWRWAAVWLTQLLYYGLVWLPWGDRPAVLFDLGARKFYIFGLVLYPQDFIYLTALLVISAYGLFFFTAIAGRLWCGYACPQTVYTEIFLWIEQKIEGERSARIRLDQSPWSLHKARVKLTKHALWLALALWTGISFVGYFVPIRDLLREILSFEIDGWSAFWVLFYSFATWGNAGFMREQVCKYMCPYARFQSAMFDRDTLIVSYDAERGEPRGKRARHVEPKSVGQGDCIDCGVCVEVCPTGIDIREGLQYECIGCGLCADACNTIMDRMGTPRGLVRYATLNSLEHRLTEREVRRHFLRPRVLIYGGILLTLTLAILISLAMRTPLKVNVIRDRGALAREVEGQYIENTYRLQVNNTSDQPQRLVILPTGLNSLKAEGDTKILVEAGAVSTAIVSLRLPLNEADSLTKGSHKIEIVVRSTDDKQLIVSEKAAFFVPH